MVLVRLNEVEKKNLEDLISRIGCRGSDLIRRLLSEKYSKMFPGYIYKKKERMEKNDIFENLKPYTPEKLCMIWGGEILQDDGILKCRKTYSKSRKSWRVLNRETIIREIKNDFESGELNLEMINERKSRS